MDRENTKIEEATKLIQLAIEDYDAFLKKINTFSPEKKEEAIKWLRNALKYVGTKQNNRKDIDK